jgi:hypothetical protein
VQHVIRIIHMTKKAINFSNRDNNVRCYLIDLLIYFYINTHRARTGTHHSNTLHTQTQTYTNNTHVHNALCMHAHTLLREPSQETKDVHNVYMHAHTHTRVYGDVLRPTSHLAHNSAQRHEGDRGLGP